VILFCQNAKYGRFKPESSLQNEYRIYIAFFIVKIHPSNLKWFYLFSRRLEKKHFTETLILMLFTGLYSFESLSGIAFAP
jgi:hypothetical protein